MKYKKVSISTVRANFRKGIKFRGFLVGNKVNSFHFFGGWYLAARIEKDTLADFECSYNSFNFYLEPELGNRVAIYVFPIKNN